MRDWIRLQIGFRTFTFTLIFFLLCLPYIFTLPIDLMDIDTAQYGEISRESLENGDFLHLKDNGRKYLDKPVLTFWTIGLFFKILGVSNLSFRLPTLVFLLLSCYGIYKIALIKYENKNISALSALIYLAIPGTYNFVLNPTIDLYLNTYLIFIHLFYYLGFKRNSNYYYIMYLFFGLGMITKGPIAIVIPMISIGGDILFRFDFRRILEMKILPGIFITSILPGFWSYILYIDFQDFGPYFFLYLQSFGRFYMKMYDQGWNPFYFPLTFIWMFLTFSPILIFIIFQFFKKNKFSISKFNDWRISNDFKQKDFVIEFWLFLYLFLISFSKYRMPQYSFWNIPAGAILIAPFLYILLFQKKSTKSFYFLNFPSLISILLILIIPIVVIDVNIFYFILVGFFISIYLLINRLNSYKKIASIFIPIACLFSIVSAFVYPELLKFQPASKIGKKVIELEPNQKELLSFGVSRSKRSYEFYSNRLMIYILQKEKLFHLLEGDQKRLAVVPGDLFFLLESYLGKEIKIEILEQFSNYKIATPQPKFLSKKFRKNIKDTVYLIRISLNKKE